MTTLTAGPISVTFTYHPSRIERAGSRGALLLYAGGGIHIVAGRTMDGLPDLTIHLDGYEYPIDLVLDDRSELQLDRLRLHVAKAITGELRAHLNGEYGEWARLESEDRE